MSAASPSIRPDRSTASSAVTISSNAWLVPIRSSIRSLVHFTARSELARREADEELLGIERRLAAEAAADVGRDHPQPVARQVERLGQAVAQDAGNLRRRMQGELVAAGVVFGKAGARLDRRGGLAAHAKAAADRREGLGERRRRRRRA